VVQVCQAASNNPSPAEISSASAIVEEAASETGGSDEEEEEEEGGDGDSASSHITYGAHGLLAAMVAVLLA
jgi:hypothetical protein